ncbi:MAG: sialate O-acetylesterase [Thermoguttaceae bacterium]
MNMNNFRQFFIFVTFLFSCAFVFAAEPKGDGVRFDGKTGYQMSATTKITIDGKPLEFFDPAQTEYRYYLPHEHVGLPKVEVADGTVTESTSEKMVSVVIPSGTGTSTTYRIVFETLPELDLFLCIGQSNMAGRGPMDASKGDMEPIPNVYLFTPAGNWIPATNPLNRFSTTRKEMPMQQICPAYGFAKKLVAQTNRPIGLVVNARGGTSIEEWTKTDKERGRTDFNLYEEAMKRALDAKKWGNYRAILWHQGEANSSRAGAYPDQLKKLVSDLRSDLGDSKLFFVAGELGRWQQGVSQTKSGFNEMLGGIPKVIERTAVVSTEDLTPIRGDIKDPHFDRESQIILGERYADAVKTGVYSAP